MQYRMCNQSVYVYRAKDGEYQTLAVSGVFLEPSRLWDETGKGETAKDAFLLVVPVSKTDYIPQKGDKISRDNRGAINDAKAWANFIPAKVTGLKIIGAVAEFRDGRGALSHYEAHE